MTDTAYCPEHGVYGCPKCQVLPLTVFEGSPRDVALEEAAQVAEAYGVVPSLETNVGKEIADSIRGLKGPR